MKPFRSGALGGVLCGLSLIAFGCSTKAPNAASETPAVIKKSGDDKPKSKGAARGPGAVETVSLAAVKADKSKAQFEARFRTQFRAVLAGGYRVRPPKLTDKYHAYCRSSYAELLKNPKALRPLLEQKLREGRINERPLAIHLLGALGKSAQSSARHVASVAIRSWEVAVNRCLAKSKGQSVKGRPVEASAEERAVCVTQLGGRRAPSSLTMACSALRKMGDSANVSRILKTGIAGHFARPCTAYFVENDVDSAEALRFIAEELDGKPNGDLLWSGLVRRGPEGVAAMMKILEVRARSKKVYDEEVCLAARFTESYRAEGGTMEALSEETRSRLAIMASGTFEDEVEVPVSISRCARQSLKALKGPMPKNVRPLRPLKPEEDMFPFCPEARSQPRPGRTP